MPDKNGCLVFYCFSTVLYFVPPSDSREERPRRAWLLWLPFWGYCSPWLHEWRSWLCSVQVSKWMSMVWRYSSYSPTENRRPLGLYSKARVRAEKEEAGKQGEPSVLISYHCSVTPTVTFML